jgi:RimJ/RimL family protein N-acetyltransferase
MPGAIFLETENIELKTVEREDLELLQEIGNHSELRKYSPSSTPVNMEKQVEIFENLICSDNNIFLLICTEEPIGWINLKNIDKDSGKAEIGLRILPEHQKKGYGTEAGKKMIKYGFKQLRLHRIYSRTFSFNTAAKNLMKKLDMTHEGRHRKEEFKNGEYQDVEYYSILKHEWENPK